MNVIYYCDSCKKEFDRKSAITSLGYINIYNYPHSEIHGNWCIECRDKLDRLLGTLKEK